MYKYLKKNYYLTNNLAVKLIVFNINTIQFKLIQSNYFVSKQKQRKAFRKRSI